MIGIVTQTQALAEESLRLHMQRQNIVLSNIANVDTPGYKAKEFSFETALQEATRIDLEGQLTTTNVKHYPQNYTISNLQGSITTDDELRTIHGLDKVNLEKELKTLMETNLSYNALAQVVRAGYTGIQDVIKGAL